MKNREDVFIYIEPSNTSLSRHFNFYSFISSPLLSIPLSPPPSFSVSLKKVLQFFYFLINKKNEDLQRLSFSFHFHSDKERYFQSSDFLVYILTGTRILEGKVFQEVSQLTQKKENDAIIRVPKIALCPWRL